MYKGGGGVQSLGFLQVSHLEMVDPRHELSKSRDPYCTRRNKITVVNKSFVQYSRPQTADDLVGIR